MLLQECLGLMKAKAQHFRSLTTRKPTFTVAFHDEHLTGTGLRIPRIEPEEALPCVRQLENKRHLLSLLASVTLARKQSKLADILNFAHASGVKPRLIRPDLFSDHAHPTLARSLFPAGFRRR